MSNRPDAPDADPECAQASRDEDGISDGNRSGDESDDGILVIQPDETSSHNALKRLVDDMFVHYGSFRIGCVVYEEMHADQEGVSRRLRSTLFPGTNQIKRRGKRRIRPEATGEGDHQQRGGSKQVQRQSKQKERCENKLMSLIFATVYDYSSKRCRLAGDVPPLKLIKKDRKGKRRSVSNYTEVRSYLRYAMGLVLACHTSSVKILSEMVPSVFGNLPSLFMLISRTFMAIFALENASEGIVHEEENTAALEKEWQEKASAAVDVCIHSIQEYLNEWGDRSYSRKKKFRKCREAGERSECYQAIYRLLREMINLMPPSPTFPFHASQRRRYLYDFSLSHNGQCVESLEECRMGALCPRAASGQPATVGQCHKVVEAIAFCTGTSLSIPTEVCDNELNDIEFPTALWKTTVTEVDLHRLNEMSTRVKNLQESNPSGGCTTTICEDFIAQVKFYVVQCWAAISRSNIDAMKMIGTMGILKKDMLRETVVELVFGGGIAGAAVFEHDEEVRAIAEKLHGRKANQRSEEAAEDAVPVGDRDAGNASIPAQPESAPKEITGSGQTQPGDVENEDGEAAVVSSDALESRKDVDNSREDNTNNAIAIEVLEVRERKTPNVTTEGGEKESGAGSDDGDAENARQSDQVPSPSKQKLAPKKRSDIISSDEEQQEPQRRANVRKGGKRKRRNTITRTVEESNTYPRSSHRTRKKTRTN